MKSIFVSIASFCDPYLQFTLKSLFLSSSGKFNINVALIDQSTDNNLQWLSQQKWFNKIKYIQLHPLYSQGVSWARSIAFSAYYDEEYVLQIDSHTYFDQNWDTALVEQLDFLQSLTPKAIYTTYPPPFKFDENNQPYKTLKPARTVYWMRPKPDQTIAKDNFNLEFYTDHVFEADFTISCNIAAGLIFTSGDFIHDVPYDPYMYFLGEEQNLTIRAFTRGWTMYNPMHDNIPIYHFYRNPGEAHPTQHWNQELERVRIIKFSEFQERSKKRLCDLLLGNRGNQPFGLGAASTLKDFADQTGIDYTCLTINPALPIKIMR
ncbi:MAG: GlcNAc-transferase family protein [Bosea sp. (in: a-proteobacteria)]